MRYFLSSLLLMLCCLLPGVAEPTLSPAKTQAVVVGVLEWELPMIPTFPKEGRQDKQLVKSLLDRGIPPGQIHYLADAQATREAIYETFSKVKQQSGPEDTLIFYYTGHGSRRNNVVRLYEFDAQPGQGLTLESLEKLISENFHGKRVLLFGDFCYSGGLLKVSQSLQRRGYESAAITSTLPDALSGPNWTYTMSLIDCFRGVRPADHDLNHKVTLKEAKVEVSASLAYTQRQVMGYSFDGLSENLVLSYVTSIDTNPVLPTPYQAYEYVRMLQPGVWLGARLMGTHGDDFVARTQGYNDRPIFFASQDTVRPNPSPPQPTGWREGEELASVGHRYRDLLRRVKVPYDYLDFGPLQQRGFQTAKVYGQYESLPDGFWVYLYPYWYIWGKDSDTPGTSSGISVATH